MTKETRAQICCSLTLACISLNIIWCTCVHTKTHTHFYLVLVTLTCSKHAHTHTHTHPHAHLHTYSFTHTFIWFSFTVTNISLNVKLNMHTNQLSLSCYIHSDLPLSAEWCAPYSVSSSQIRLQATTWKQGSIHSWQCVPLNDFNQSMLHWREKNNNSNHWLYAWKQILHSAYDYRIACWWEHQTHDRKVASSNPGRRIFFSRVNFVRPLIFSVHSTPLVTAVARKRPGSFCQKWRWQVTRQPTTEGECSSHRNNQIITWKNKQQDCLFHCTAFR